MIPFISRREMDVSWSRLTPPFQPTAAQWPIHTDQYRFKLVAGGERAGKSATVSMYAIPRIPYCDLIWIVGPDYTTPRAEFTYIRNALAQLEMIAEISEPKSQAQPAMLVTTTGCEIRTRTAHDEAKLASTPPDLIIGVEAAQMTYEAYLRMTGRVAERRGQILLSGTFETSQDWYADLYSEWLTGDKDSKSYSLPSWSNTVIYPKGIDDPEMLRLASSFTEERFKERHAGIPVNSPLAVHPEFNYLHHVTDKCQFNPSLPVYLAIDPGHRGAYAVCAIQLDETSRYTHKHRRTTVNVIDEVYLQRKSVREVIKETRTKPWWKNVNPYNAGIIDIAGTQHQGNESHAEVWASHPTKGGAGIKLSSIYVPIIDGIDRMRDFLRDVDTGEPVLYFNPQCINTTKEFKLYRYPETHAKTGIVKELPIDAHNHSIKAITYWLCANFGFTQRKATGIKSARFTAPTDYNDDSMRKAQYKLLANPDWRAKRMTPRRERGRTVRRR